MKREVVHQATPEFGNATRCGCDDDTLIQEFSSHPVSSIER